MQVGMEVCLYACLLVRMYMCMYVYVSAHVRSLKAFVWASYTLDMVRENANKAVGIPKGPLFTNPH